MAELTFPPTFEADANIINSVAIENRCPFKQILPKRTIKISGD